MRRWGINFPQLTDTTKIQFVMRRAASKTNPIILIGVVTGVGVLTLLGAWFLGGFADSFRGIDKIDAGSYAESARPFQGGTYQFEGAIDSDLGFEQGTGRLISFRVSSSKGQIFLPALIPDFLKRMNPQKGQAYKVKVVGRDDGLLVVEKLEKL